MDEVEKAEGPLFLSMCPSPQFAPTTGIRSRILQLAPLERHRSAYAILRGKRGRRHEVDFGSSPLRVEVHASQEIVEIYIEADFDTLPEDRRRFAGLSMSRQQFSEATGGRGSQSRPERPEQEMIAITLRAGEYSAFAQPDCSESRLWVRAIIIKFGSSSAKRLEPSESALGFRRRLTMRSERN